MVRFSRKTQVRENMGYTINTQQLERTENIRYLGVIFSSDLLWNSHINFITNKANSMLGFLRRNFCHCPKELKETLYFSFVRSVLEYACIVWDPQTKNLSDKLEQVQNRCARFVSNIYRFKASVTAIKQQLHWQPLSYRRKKSKTKIFLLSL